VVLANSQSAIYYSIHLSPLGLLCLHQFTGHSFQWRTYPLPLGSWTVPIPQLPAYNRNSSQGLKCSSPLTNSLTHSPVNWFHLTPRLAAISHQPLTLLTVISKLSSNSSWYSLVRTAQRTLPEQLFLPLLCMCLLQPLPSNGYCMAAYFMVIAWQWVYMPQYFWPYFYILFKHSSEEKKVCTTARFVDSTPWSRHAL
jgi:hypothetical protein